MKLMTWNIKDGGVLDFNVPIVSNIQNIIRVIKYENPDVVIIKNI